MLHVGVRTVNNFIAINIFFLAKEVFTHNLGFMFDQKKI